MIVTGALAAFASPALAQVRPAEANVRSALERIARVDPHIPTLEDLYFAVRKQRAQNRTRAADPDRSASPANGAGNGDRAGTDHLEVAR